MLFRSVTGVRVLFRSKRARSRAQIIKIDSGNRNDEIDGSSDLSSQMYGRRPALEFGQADAFSLAACPFFIKRIYEPFVCFRIIKMVFFTSGARITSSAVNLIIAISEIDFNNLSA